MHYEGNDSWVEPTILEIKEIVNNDKTPDADEECDTCSYVGTRFELELFKLNSYEKYLEDYPEYKKLIEILGEHYLESPMKKFHFSG